MKALIQRVESASVEINGKIVSVINQGMLVLLGVMNDDGKANAELLADKLIKLRIFEDESGKMNKSLIDIKGEILVVSQFTLCADCKKGSRPGFDKSAPPQEAKELYEYFVKQIEAADVPCQTGVFGADMRVSLINDGPVTFMVEK